MGKQIEEIIEYLEHRFGDDAGIAGCMALEGPNGQWYECVICHKVTDQDNPIEIWGIGELDGIVRIQVMGKFIGATIGVWINLRMGMDEIKRPQN